MVASRDAGYLSGCFRARLRGSTGMWSWSLLGRGAGLGSLSRRFLDSAITPKLTLSIPPTGGTTERVRLAELNSMTLKRYAKFFGLVPQALMPPTTTAEMLTNARTMGGAATSAGSVPRPNLPGSADLPTVGVSLALACLCACVPACLRVFIILHI